MKMSLHRIIAEIKAIEEFLTTIPSQQFVTVQKGVDTEESLKAKQQAQSDFDKVLAKTSNLAKLKAARNKANSDVIVTIAGKQYTIDEALARKANLQHESSLLSHLKNQYTRANTQVVQANNQLDVSINNTITQIVSGRQAAPEELQAIRETTEKSQKQKVLTFDGFDTKIKNLEDEIKKFSLEVDYSLSEANATNFVEIDLLS